MQRFFSYQHLLRRKSSEEFGSNKHDTHPVNFPRYKKQLFVNLFVNRLTLSLGLELGRHIGTKNGPGAEQDDAEATPDDLHSRPYVWCVDEANGHVIRKSAVWIEMVKFVHLEELGTCKCEATTFSALSGF